MRESVCISLPNAIKKNLDRLSKREHLDRSSVVQQALREFLAKEEFRSLRRLMVPKAQSRGIYTDEDVFKKVS
ncbi:MAG: ribbon-helix-helix protein, CopG family [Elusimicrobia bacterium]|nr:ribbon-helix-helix protein, CopG family [Elusimicrobiota bacterium]